MRYKFYETYQYSDNRLKSRMIYIDKSHTYYTNRKKLLKI